MKLTNDPGIPVQSDNYDQFYLIVHSSFVFSFSVSSVVGLFFIILLLTVHTSVCYFALCVYCFLILFYNYSLYGMEHHSSLTRF